MSGDKKGWVEGVELLNDIFHDENQSIKRDFYPNPNSDESILSSKKHFVIEASAGTGKTYFIKKLYFDLIYRGLKPEQILVVTFTRAATAELRTRLLEQIQEGIKVFRDKKNSETAADNSYSGEADHSYCWEIDEFHYGRLVSARDEFYKASIYTLDSLTQRVLREHQDKSVMHADAAVTDDSGMMPVYREAFDIFMHEITADDESAEYNKIRDIIKSENKFDIKDSEPLNVNLYNNDTSLFRKLVNLIKYHPVEHSTETENEGSADPDYKLAVDVIPAFYKVIERVKMRRCRYLYKDFTDMLDRSSQAISDKVSDQWRVVIVDEFQDTSAEQWSFLEKCFLSEGSKSSLFIIGDPKQAIYGFRGCDLFVYKTAVDKIENSEIGKKLSLNTNYRSSPSMVNVINELYDKNKKSLFLDDSDDEEAKVSEEDKEKCNDYEHVECKNKGWGCFDKDNAEKPALVRVKAEDEDEYIAYIAATIKNLIGDNPGLLFKDDKCKEPKAVQNIYILAKEHKHLQRISDALVKADIDFGYASKKSFFKSAENIDLFRIMRAIANPGDEGCAADALNTVLFGMPVYHVKKVISDKTHPIWARFKEWSAMSKDRFKFHRIFNDILKTTQFEMRMKLFSYSDEPYKNVCRMIDCLVEHSLYEELDWEALIEWYTACCQNEPSDNDESIATEMRQRVQLLTMHSCKGLQADVVFLYGKNDKTLSKSSHKKQKIFHTKENNIWKKCFSSCGDDEEKAQLESEFEMERLLYVSLTRARYRLYVPYYDSSKWDGAWGRLYDAISQKGIDCCEESACQGTADNECDQDVDEIGILLDRLKNVDGEKIGQRELLVLDDSVRYAGMRENLSYSMIKKNSAGGIDYAADEMRSREKNEYDVLPGGTNTGLFMHELLEKTDFGAIQDFADRNLIDEANEAQFLEFLLNARSNSDDENLSSIRRIFGYLCLKYQIEKYDARRAAALMLWRVLTLRTDYLENRRLCDCNYKMAEVGFLTNYKDMEKIGGASEIDFFNGSIDCCCRYDVSQTHKWYLIDWKTDTLPNYTESVMAKHTESHYRDQKEIYTCAFNKWLDNRGKGELFGGMLYVYLRGIKPTGNTGVYFYR